jgi:hypothetical protein
VIAAAPAAAPPAARADGVLVRVGRGERHLSSGEIAAAVDRPAGTYLLRAPATTAEPVAHPPALSVRRLAQLAGASPDALTFVSIERPNGTLATLGRADVADPPPFAEGPPIVWIDAGGTRYLRPLRGPGDVNATDNIGVTGADLVIRLHQGPLLAVRAEADRRAVRAGQSVSFTAQVEGATPGAALTYDWTFGDGTRKRGPGVRHVFRTPGVYDALVSVNGADDSGGSSVPLRIRVGDPPKGDGAAGGGTGDPGRAPAQGPAEATSSNDGGGSTSRNSGSGGARPSTGASPSAAEPGPSASPAPRPPAAPAPRRRARSAAKPATGASRPPARRSARRRAPARAAARPAPQAGQARRSRPAAPRGRLVRGTLVVARITAPPPGAAATPAGAAAAAAGGPAAARRGDLGTNPIAPVAGGLALALLLALGVRRERRGLRPGQETAA